MSNLTYSGGVLRVYGGMPSGDPSIQLSLGPSNAGVPETLAVGTYRRVVMGPKQGEYSMHVIVDSAAGAASTLTFWYSNHPNPSLASDNDWVLTTDIASIDLTAATPTYKNVTGTCPEWIMAKAVVAASPGAIRVFYRGSYSTYGQF